MITTTAEKEESWKHPAEGKRLLALQGHEGTVERKPESPSCWLLSYVFIEFMLLFPSRRISFCGAM